MPLLWRCWPVEEAGAAAGAGGRGAEGLAEEDPLVGEVLGCSGGSEPETRRAGNDPAGVIVRMDVEDVGGRSSKAASSYLAGIGERLASRPRCWFC